MVCNLKDRGVLVTGETWCLMVKVVALYLQGRTVGFEWQVSRVSLRWDSPWTVICMSWVLCLR
jgi:hypothetical protein